MMAEWRKGYDVVEAVRTSRPNDSFLKRVMAGAFYFVFGRVARIDITANSGDFRLLDRRAVEALRRLPERNRFMKGLFAWIGFATAEIHYDRPARAAGSTKFGFWRLWNFALDGILSHTTAPLRIWTYIGCTIAFAAILYAVILFTRTLVHGVDLPGYASLMIVVLVATAVQLISIGILGEYLGRVFNEVKPRPIYIAQEVAGGREIETSRPPQLPVPTILAARRT